MNRTLTHLWWNVTAAAERLLFIRTDCAWCGRVLRRPMLPSRRVSHGICPACAAAQKQLLALPL